MSIKVKDLISDQERAANDKLSSEDENSFCDICETSTRAEKFFMDPSRCNQPEELSGVIHFLDVRCPYCHGRLKFAFEGAVPAHAHQVHPEDEVFFSSLMKCPNCKTNHDDARQFVIIPMEVRHNANHDVYTCAGHRSLPDHDEVTLEETVKKRCDSLIANFYKRVKDGEKLTEENLQYWLRNEITGCVADFLTEKGLIHPPEKQEEVKDEGSH